MSEQIVRLSDEIVEVADGASRRGIGEGLQTARGRANVARVLRHLGYEGVRVDDDGTVWVYGRDGEEDWDDPSWV